MTQRKKTLKEMFETKETAMVQKLRNYYRINFKNGKSNDSFLLWIESKIVSGEVK